MYNAKEEFQSRVAEISKKILTFQNLESQRKEKTNDQSGFSLKQIIWQLLQELQKFAMVRQLYFFDCDISTYIATFEFRFNQFLQNNPDGNKMMFVIYELKKLYNPQKHRILCNPLPIKYNDYILGNSFEESLNLKIDYLIKQVEPGYEVIVDKEGGNVRLEVISIFNNAQAKALFEDFLIEKKVLSRLKIPSKGLFTVATAFYRYDQKKEFFQDTTTRKKLINYLNAEYKLSLKSEKSLPNTILYEDSIKSFLEARGVIQKKIKS